MRGPIPLFGDERLWVAPGDLCRYRWRLTLILDVVAQPLIGYLDLRTKGEHEWNATTPRDLVILP
ncbi:MAG: hypothetical protein VYB51_05225, partial [Gemmatimonadota bacterium]|nr:hypothetical protein [Gemmatimonadota bacterium]